MESGGNHGTQWQWNLGSQPKFNSNFTFRPPVSAQTDSCLQLLKLLGFNEAKHSNFVLSPLSLYVALSSLAPGCSGATLEQLLAFLKSQSLHHLNSTSSRLVEDLVRGTSVHGGPVLSFISGVWVDRSLALKPAFRDVLQTVYTAEAEAVDFRHQAGEVRNEVNTWAERRTNGLIKDLLPEGSVDHLTRLILANSLYFKGAWSEEFDRSKTKNSEFHLLDGSCVQVPFMTSENGQFIRSFSDGLRVLKLPYRQDFYNHRRYSMYIFLPHEKDGLWPLLDRVSSDSGFLDCHLPEQQVQVKKFMVPRFKIAFGFEASRALKDLGLWLPFSPPEAELTELVSNLDPGNDRLYVSRIHQKCFINMNEEGTEATAATAIVCRLQQGAVLLNPMDFVADHPFMFTIRDDVSGAVLFMGCVLNPLMLGD